MTYPSSPGFKEGDTSRAAAEAMAPRAPKLRDVVFRFIAQHPGHTADEIASILLETPFAVRPRVSELHRLGLITQAGKGKNKSGATAHTWKAS